MKTYFHQFEVAASLEEVAAFHHGTQVLKKLVPPPVIVQLKHYDPLAEGAKAEFTMWLGPVPVHWEALHTEVDRLKGFKDTQVKGPFEEWCHHHKFEAVDENRSLVIDEIQYQYGKGLWRGLVSRMMAFGLPFMFAYRARVTRRSIKQIVNR